MTDKEFDKLLKGKLEDYQPNYDQSSWEDLENRIENEVGPEVSDPFDNAVKAALGQFAVSNSNGNWEEMERRIIEDENVSFDQEVRENVENYQAPYDASSWPVLDEKIVADERFRRRLVGAKILEIAAILIALITFYNVFPDIKNSLFDKQQQNPSEETISNEHFASSHENITAKSANDLEKSETEVLASHGVSTADSKSSRAEQVLSESNPVDIEGSSLAGDPKARMVAPVVQLEYANLTDHQIETNHQVEVKYPIEGALTDGSTPASSTSYVNQSLSNIEVLGLPNQLDPHLTMEMPTIALTHKRKSLRFSIGASMDLNALYMPEENFYANGEQITFSEKNLLATGYSAGVGLLFGDGAWSFETGLYYSSKKYEPNRIIQVGKTFDVRTLDFSEINLHIVSVPMYAHWNFDRKGKTRFYALAGTGINLIADAHYDLITRNNFRSGPSGGVRDKNTDYEVARIREHILDGAEFSSKSYITLVGGLGVEHHIGDKLSLFAQPTFNYQVPFFQFSDQNGKQFKYISMQFGTRVRLR